MGRALARAAIDSGHQATIVSGPVHVEYPPEATVVPVVTTDEMLAAANEAFIRCDGLIGAAAPCDYRPVEVEPNKIKKTGQPLRLNLIETPDVVATLGAGKNGRWVVGFALETEDVRFRALTKLQRKSCDLMVLNGPQAMEATDNEVEIIDAAGSVLESLRGSKEEVAHGILRLIQQRLIDSAPPKPEA